MSNSQTRGSATWFRLECCNENICQKESISIFEKELINEIDAAAYAEPTIVHFAEHSYKAAGYSLLQLIETSLANKKCI